MREADGAPAGAVAPDALAPLPRPAAEKTVPAPPSAKPASGLADVAGLLHWIRAQDHPGTVTLACRDAEAATPARADVLVRWPGCLDDDAIAAPEPVSSPYRCASRAPTASAHGACTAMP